MATHARSKGRAGLTAILAAGLLAAGTLTVASAGTALAEPPQHAVDNHEAATEGKAHNDNSVLHEDEPEPVAVSAVQAATVEPEREPVLLPCGGTVTADGKGVNPDVAIRRLVDADLGSSDDCVPLPVELASIPNGLRFVKPAGSPLAQFFVDVVWTRTTKELDDPATVDFESVPGGYNVPLESCPDSVRDETGEVVGLAVDTDVTPEQFASLGIVDQDGAPSVWNPEDNGLTQFACVVSSTPVYEPGGDGGPQWKVTERLWLMGDVIFRG